MDNPNLSYLAVVQQLLAEREEACLRDHSDLIVGIATHLNLCPALPSTAVASIERIDLASPVPCT
ncbi:MAG: hypothetical protein ACREXS_06615 [Gammaproteobacteria bacterium]